MAKKSVVVRPSAVSSAAPDAGGGIDYGLSGLGELLRGYRLLVPRFQRNYAWGAEHVEDLLGDFSLAIGKNEPRHFVGSVVLTRASNSELEVVDGQQRLATAFMVLCAIRDFFKGQHDDVRAQMIEDKFLFVPDLKSRETFPRLSLNGIDNAYFQCRVVNRPLVREAAIKESTSSHGRIDEAFGAVCKWVESIANEAGTSASDVLIKWVDFIDSGASAMRVIVPDHAAAFTIFETLNDRGIELAISDLIKNFLFAAAGDSIESAETYWIKMSGVLDAMSEKEVQANYLRHFWSSLRGLTRERDIFKGVKSCVVNKKDALKLCDDLARNATYYAALVNPAHPLWRAFTPECKSLLGSIMILRVSQVRPLLLAVFDTFKPMEVLKALRVIVSASVRILVSQSRGGVVEKMYAELAFDVREKRIGGAAALLAEIRKKVPGDAEFEEAFRGARVSTSYLACYYLRQLERYVNASLGGLVISDSTADITLEHVLPVSCGSAWSAFDADSHASQVNRIGNLCLLAEDENTSVGNDSFAAKKKVYRKSRFVLTKRISCESEWTKEEIDARSAVLASLAVKTWPLSTDMVKPLKPSKSSMGSGRVQAAKTSKSAKRVGSRLASNRRRRK